VVCTKVVRVLLPMACVLGVRVALAQPGIPMPLVGWCGELPAAAHLDDPVHYDTETLAGFATDAALTPIRLLPSGINAGHAARCRPTWTNGRERPGAVRLCPSDAGAESGAVVQCGEGPGALKPARQLTLFVSFRLDAPMSLGGGSPPWELDGTLVGFAPGVRLAVTGRGPEGRGRRLPQLRLAGSAAGWDGACDSVYTPQVEGELRLGQWYALAMTWDGAKPSEVGGTGATQRVRM